jgi:hypothetical protein
VAFDDEPDDVEDAIAMWETFHQRDWNKVGEFYPRMKLPERLVVLGKAEHVMYRSNKREPESGRIPKRPLDYIHEHDENVRIAVPFSSKLKLADQRKAVALPRVLSSATTFARLGFCLGFAYSHRGEVLEVEARRPLPELYAIASGKALLVIQDKCKIEAIIWGGRLDVESRGIVH